LKAELKRRRLPTTGRKAILVARLRKRVFEERWKTTSKVSQEHFDVWIKELLDSDKRPDDPMRAPKEEQEKKWQTLVAWILIHEMNLTPFGGFLRDRAAYETPRAGKDIDTAISESMSLEEVQKNLDKCLKKVGIKQGKNEDGKYAHWRRDETSSVYNCYYATPSETRVHVQLVDKTAKGMSWSPDFTVNGLAISAERGLHSIADELTVATIMEHLRRRALIVYDCPTLGRLKRVKKRLRMFTRERDFHHEGPSLVEYFRMNSLGHAELIRIMRSKLGVSTVDTSLGRKCLQVRKEQGKKGDTLFAAVVEFLQDDDVDVSTIRKYVCQNLKANSQWLVQERNIGRLHGDPTHRYFSKDFTEAIEMDHVEGGDSVLMALAHVLQRQVIVYLGFSKEYLVHKTVYTSNNTKPENAPFQVLIPLDSWKGGSKGNQRFLCARGGYQVVEGVTENRGHNVVSKVVDEAVNQALATTEFGCTGKECLRMATSFQSTSKKPEKVVAGLKSWEAMVREGNHILSAAGSSKHFDNHPKARRNVKGLQISSLPVTCGEQHIKFLVDHFTRADVVGVLEDAAVRVSQITVLVTELAGLHFRRLCAKVKEGVVPEMSPWFFTSGFWRTMYQLVSCTGRKKAPSFVRKGSGSPKNIDLAELNHSGKLFREKKNAAFGIL
jgi:hypothetical protein